MVVKEVALIGIEAANPRRRLHIDSHAPKRIGIGDGRDERFARVLERNETPVKEVIDGRGDNPAGLPQARWVITCVQITAPSHDVEGTRLLSAVADEYCVCRKSKCVSLAKKGWARRSGWLGDARKARRQDHLNAIN